MPFDFGNKYGMNKAEFEKSIEYFKNKITMIEDDNTISPSVKRWFIKRYNKRIQELEEDYLKLQETINEVKESKYVNEETATLNSLRGTSSKDNHAFRDFNSSEKRHKTGQFFRVLSMFTIVGLPFAIPGFIRSRQRHKLRKQENIELKEFVNTSNKPYSSKIGTTEAFSEEEMVSLLSNPTELANVVALTSATSSVLNATQKKNLSKQLVGLKEYAQKNGYSIGTTLNAFETSTDNLNKKYTTATASAPTNLKEAYDKLVELNNIKSSLEGVLETDPENTTAKNLLTNVNNSITAYTNNAKTFVNDGISAIDADLDSKKTSSSAKADLEASNTGLDTVYNTPHAKFGTDLATAKTMADNLKIETSNFDSLTTKYTQYKNSNNTKLAEIIKEEEFNNDLGLAKGILDTITPDDIDSHVKATEALANLGQVETILNKHKSFFESLPAGPQRDKYTNIRTNYSSLKSEITKKQQDLAIDDSTFSTYKNKIDDNAYTDTDTADELRTKKDILQTALDALKDTRFDDIFRGSSREADLTNAKLKAQEEIGKIDAKLADIAKDELNAAKNLTYYKGVVDSNKPESIDSTADLLAKRGHLKNVLAVIDTSEYKDGFDEAEPVITDAKNYISDIEIKLKPYLTFVEKLTKAYEYLSTTLSSGRSSEKKIENAQKWYKLLEPLSAEASTYGLSAEHESILNAYKGYLETKRFDSVLEVHIPSTT